MDNTLLVTPAPHITKRHNTTRIIMLHVLVALAPVVIAATIIFGHLVIVNVLFCVLFCMGLELLYDVLIGKKRGKTVKNSTAWDCSSVVTGVILALNIPTFLDIWGLHIKSGDKVILSFDTVIACFIGCLVAIVLVKMLFGGIGKNFANPAAVGRIFLFVACASAFSSVYSGAAGGVGGLSGVTGATWLSERSAVPLLDMFLGRTNAAATGETCVIAIALGFAYLCVMRVVDFRVPLVVVGSALVFLLLFDGLLKYPIHNAVSINAQVLTSPLKTAGDWGEFALRHLMSGGLLFGAVFMCSDYATTPNTLKGRLVFAAGVGFFTAILRTWAMPEGISFAIVIMNILTPHINRLIKPRFFGAEGSITGKSDKGKQNAIPAPQPKTQEVGANEK